MFLKFVEWKFVLNIVMKMYVYVYLIFWSLIVMLKIWWLCKSLMVCVKVWCYVVDIDV